MMRMNFSSALKLTMLLVALTGLLMIFGQLIGGTEGLVFAFFFSLLSQGFAYWNSDKIALRMNQAREASESEYSQIYSITRKLVHRANLPMPKIYICPEPLPNAFATGRDPQHSAVALTQGLLETLNDSEIEGVIAHELGHIKNRDVFISTVAAVIAGTISSITQFALIFGAGHRDREGGASNPIVMIVTLILAPILALVIQMAISRSREYEADQSAIDMTFNPNGLASALKKITEISKKHYPQALQPAFSSLYIANPFAGDFMNELMSTHPPIEKRIERIYSRSKN